MMETGDKITFAISWPFVWNAANKRSWTNAEREDAEDPGKGKLENHINRVQFHFSTPINRFSNCDVSGAIPKSPGLNDPFEGFIINPKTIRIELSRMTANASRQIDPRWRSVCFSQVHCDEDEIEDAINQKVISTNGYESKNIDYVYAKFSGDLLFRFINSCCVGEKRIGAAFTTVHYWDSDGIKSEDEGKMLYPPYVGLYGNSVVASVIKGRVECNGIVITEKECDEFIKSISSVVPFKYKPAYGSENEVRFSFYSFDKWNSDIEIVRVSNEDAMFKLGRYDGDFK